MRQIVQETEGDSPPQVQGIITYSFRDGNIPLGDDQFLSVPEVRKLIVDKGLSELLNVDYDAHGAKIDAINFAGINRELVISDTFAFIDEDVDGTWGQYTTLVINRLK